MHRAWLVTALLACKQQEPPPPAPVPQATPIDATIADAAVVDAPPPADAGEVVWPAAIESAMVEVDRKIGAYAFVLSYPTFKTRPPAIGRELTALIAKLADPGLDPKAHQGQLDLACERKVVNRLVVILECSRMNDARTLAEARAGTGGAPAGPDRLPIAVWLQPGLPAIDVHDLAPGVDVTALLGKATCTDQCTFTADRFVIDDDGAIRFVPAHGDSGYCAPPCATDDAPRIELAAIKPTHPWAKKLDAWIRQRLAAGEALVK